MQLDATPPIPRRLGGAFAGRIVRIAALALLLASTGATILTGATWAQDDPATAPATEPAPEPAPDPDADSASDPATDPASVAANDPTAEALARLTVVPHGDQSFDLLTGETTLPDGGVIVDTETGLRLDAGFVRYREGAFIEARDATAETADGSLIAPELRIDVPTLVARAPAGLRYVREGLELVADGAELRFGPELVRFENPTGASLDLEARALLLDLRTGDALLLGPYRFQDGPFVLTDDREDATLQLRPVTTDAGTPTYRAANEVDEDLWMRTAPLR